MVGRSLKEILPKATYLSSKDYDLTSEIDIIKMFDEQEPDCIIHLAAKVGGIIDNINKPAQYFTDNVLMNTLLLEYAYQKGVKRFIGILSTCIYPDQVDEYPMTEDMLHLGPPTPTNFSYGYAKRCLAVQIEAYNKQYGTTYQYLTPCNLYGEYDKFGENSHFIAALIKKIHIAKTTKADHITLFGSGTPLRQFMYSGDLANIIKTCLDEEIYESFNVATEENLSIREMAKIALDACGATYLDIKFDSTKPDGQFRKDVSPAKMFKTIPNINITKLFNGIKYTYDKVLSHSLVL